MTTTITPATTDVAHWYLAPPGARSGIGTPDGDGAPVALVRPVKRWLPLGELATSLEFVTRQGDVLFSAAARAAGTPGCGAARDRWSWCTTRHTSRRS